MLRGRSFVGFALASRPGRVLFASSFNIKQVVGSHRLDGEGDVLSATRVSRKQRCNGMRRKHLSGFRFSEAYNTTNDQKREHEQKPKTVSWGFRTFSEAFR